MSRGVLEFLEETKVLPKVQTVKRTQASKYLFYLLASEYKRRLGLKPRFFTYSKAEANVVKGMMEEHSIFQDTNLFVLEGFSQSFVKRLMLPEGMYCIAETEEGELDPEPYSYKNRRDILKVLCMHLGLRLSLRVLMQLDWAFCKDYCDYEAFLRKAKLMGWTEGEVLKRGKSSELTCILVELKKGHLKDALELQEKYGATWMLRYLTEITTQVAQYRLLRAMGYDELRATQEMEVGYIRGRELEEASKALTTVELSKMATRLVELDGLVGRNKSVGVELLLLNNPIQIAKY